jgi:predicted nucleic acid-binding protein
MRNAASASLYVESSGLLAWLLGEAQGEETRRLLADAGQVLTSELTLIECDRVLIRTEALGDITAARRADLTAVLRAATARWSVLKVDGEVVARARRPFPQEPVRTLDAIHLASALVARSAVKDLAVLSLDDRIRAAGRLLGLDVLPA